MCLGIPGKVVDIYRENDVRMGKVDFNGIWKWSYLGPDLKRYLKIRAM